MGTPYPDAPRVAVGAVVFKGDHVLLVCRRNPPAAGEWAIPGGSVALGETLAAAAEREVLEETGVTVRAGDPIYTFDSIHRDDAGRVAYHYVVTDLRAEHVAGEPVPRDDALDARWVAADELAGLHLNAVTRLLLLERLGFHNK